MDLSNINLNRLILMPWIKNKINWIQTTIKTKINVYFLI